MLRLDVALDFAGDLSKNVVIFSRIKSVLPDLTQTIRASGSNLSRHLPENVQLLMDSQLLNLIHLHGLNYPEFRILLTVHYESPVPQELLARFSIEPICETAPTIAQIDEMQRVTQSCIDIGLIRVYDQKECQKDQKTWAAITNQSFFRWKKYRPGDVGFTDKGAALFYKILAEIRARDGQGLFDGYYWIDDDPLTQKIFLMGTTETDFIEKSRALKSGPLRSITSRGIKIKSIGAIQKGGPWWLNRFVLLDVIYFVEVETEKGTEFKL